MATWAAHDFKKLASWKESSPSLLEILKIVYNDLHTLKYFLRYVAGLPHIYQSQVPLYTPHPFSVLAVSRIHVERRVSGGGLTSYQRLLDPKEHVERNFRGCASSAIGHQQRWRQISSMSRWRLLQNTTYMVANPMWVTFTH